MACTSLIAIDPGDKHVGYATFERVGVKEITVRGSTSYTKMPDWQCTGAYIVDDPEEFMLDFAESLLAGDFEIVVYERFNLREDLAVEQAGSEMLTAQMIGVLKWMVNAHNRHAAVHDDAIARGLLTTCEQQGGTCSNPDTPLPRRVVLHGQQPQVQGQKGPARGVLRARGIKSVAKQMGAVPHGLSAELHGWYFIGRHIEQWGQ